VTGSCPRTHRDEDQKRNVRNKKKNDTQWGEVRSYMREIIREVTAQKGRGASTKVLSFLEGRRVWGRVK